MTDAATSDGRVWLRGPATKDHGTRLSPEIAAAVIGLQVGLPIVPPDARCPVVGCSRTGEVAQIGMDAEHLYKCKLLVKARHDAIRDAVFAVATAGTECADKAIMKEKHVGRFGRPIPPTQNPDGTKNAAGDVVWFDIYRQRYTYWDGTVKAPDERSEERRVGKECRARWSP